MLGDSESWDRAVAARLASDDLRGIRAVCENGGFGFCRIETGASGALDVMGEAGREISVASSASRKTLVYSEEHCHSPDKGHSLCADSSVCG